MSLTQQRGTVSSSEGTVQLPQLAPFEYLWIYAVAAGAGASAWWSQAPGARSPNVQLGAGQWRLVDLGAVGAWQLWVSGDLEWITDTDPITEQVTTTGPITVTTPAGAPLETVFPSAQQVTFSAPQQVVVNSGVVDATITGPVGISGTVDVTGPVSITAGQNAPVLEVGGMTGDLPGWTRILHIDFPSSQANPLEYFPTLPAAPVDVLVVVKNPNQASGIWASLFHSPGTAYNLDSAELPASQLLGASGNFSVPRATLLANAADQVGIGVELGWVTGAPGGFDAFADVYISRPGMKSGSFSTLAGSNFATAVVPAVAGQTVTVYGWEVSLAPQGGAGFYNLQLVSGATGFQVCNLQSYLFTAVGSATEHGQLWIDGGLSLPVGEALNLATGGARGGNAGLSGTVYYTQR